MKLFQRLLKIFFMCLICGPVHASSYEEWTQGPSTEPTYFPIGVWLQDPGSASTYAAAGINLYVGLWEGPTVTQLEALRIANMQTICSQNQTALDYRNVKLDDGRPLIVAYMQQDEPDNSQPQPQGSYGPPVPTDKIQALYHQMKKNDPNRPVWLNLGQGIGNDAETWVGQGGHIVPERDYPAYILGSDIVSFDIYPMNCGRAAICGDAWRVALGVDRLHMYSPPEHPVWNIIETSDIDANGQLATIDQIIAEVWMSIIHGSKGIVYFIHGKTSFSDFDHKALLRPENSDRLAALTTLNHQIHQLAPVIYQSNRDNIIGLEDIQGSSLVDYVVKIYEGATYIFSVGMREEQTIKRFTLKSYPDGIVEVLGEDRQLSMVDSQFEDTFNGYEAHLYKINAVGLAGDLD